MAACSISRFQFSRELSSLSIYPGRIPHAPAWRLHWCRKASTNSPPLKPRVLEKPTKFYPPSHPQRLAKKQLPRQYPGPPLSEAQKREQGTKKYPNTMPAEGTFMYWFLNSRLLHMSITLSVLFSLASIVFIEDFHRSTPFVDRLPPAREFWSHPFKFVATYGHIYKLHTDHVSAETAERRKKKVDDVQKRSRYRKAHGLEDEQGLGGWTAKTSHDSLGPALVSQDLPDQIGAPSSGKVQPSKASAVTDDDKSSYADFEGKKRPIKKWLGIWE